MVISLVKLLFLFNSEITVFHRYLYNNTLYMRGQSNFYYLSVNSVWNLGLGSNNCGCREITHYRTIYTQTRYCFQFNNTHVLFTLCVFVCAQLCPVHIVLCFCFVFLRLVIHMLPVSLDCPSLSAPSLPFNVYFNCKIFLL